jgi:hypothetical protein
MERKKLKLRTVNAQYYVIYVVQRYYTCVRNEISCTSYGPSCSFYRGGGGAEHVQNSVVNLVDHRSMGEAGPFVELG